MQSLLEIEDLVSTAIFNNANHFLDLIGAFYTETEDYSE